MRRDTLGVRVEVVVHHIVLEESLACSLLDTTPSSAEFLCVASVCTFANSPRDEGDVLLGVFNLSPCGVHP